MEFTQVQILLAEDSQDDADLTIRALKKSGLTNHIYHVRDGAEAINFLKCREQYASRAHDNSLKLVLLDLKMPKVDGLEVLSAIKGDPELNRLPVVILTSSREDPDIKKAYELGANSYIVKPVESDNFFKVIKELGFYWLITNLPFNG